jgi:hypothetical protein
MLLGLSNLWKIGHMARNDTYQTKVIPVVEPMGNRLYNNTTDAYSLNMVPVKMQTGDQSRVAFQKRWGVDNYQAIAGVAPIRGFFAWEEANKIFVVQDTTIYVYNAFGGFINSFVTFSSSNTPVGFTVWKDPTTNLQTLVYSDGTVLGLFTLLLAQFSSSTVAGVVGTHIPVPIAYDEYILLVKQGTGDVYNSDTPGLGATRSGLNFTAGAFITSEITGNTVFNIAKINNYFLTFGSESIEYFYDAGLAPPGTPFQRIDTFVKYTGLISNNGKVLTQFGNSIYFMGHDKNGLVDIFHLENFKLTPITTPEVRRILQHNVSQAGCVVYMNIVNFNGNNYLIIDDNITTFYYGLETQFWGLLAFQNTTHMPIYGASSINEYGNGSIFVLANDNAIMYQFNPLTYQDNFVNYNCIITTSKQDFGNNNQKFMQSMVLYIDRISGTNAAINWQTSDDDYRTWTTARPVLIDQERPNLQQLGRFRARAIKLTLTANSAFRIWGIEVDYNQGST